MAVFAITGALHTARRDQLVGAIGWPWRPDMGCPAAPMAVLGGFALGVAAICWKRSLPAWLAR